MVPQARGEDEVRTLPIIRAMLWSSLWTRLSPRGFKERISPRRAVTKGEHDPLSSSIWVVQPRSQGSHLKLSSMPSEHDCYLALSWGRRWGGSTGERSSGLSCTLSVSICFSPPHPDPQFGLEIVTDALKLAGHHGETGSSSGSSVQ